MCRERVRIVRDSWIFVLPLDVVVGIDGFAYVEFLCVGPYVVFAVESCFSWVWVRCCM